ncbi:MAG: hypothetical protein D6710_04795 [Nitrospirae bacterium]|nr:MAG: hypothetical protein D6710_04795 [Nitrospirota bacterium]
MEEIGVVKSVEGMIAKVVVERKSICDKCTEGKCLLTDGGAIIEAFNQVKAKEGQRVRVVFRPYSYLKGSVLIYGIPALMLIVGAIIGREVLSRFIEMDADLLSAIGGFSLLIITFIIVRIITARVEKNIEYKPVIEEIIEG